jgi:hypothetical protein
MAAGFPPSLSLRLGAREFTPSLGSLYDVRLNDALSRPLFQAFIFVKAMVIMVPKRYPRSTWRAKQRLVYVLWCEWCQFFLPYDYHCILPDRGRWSAEFNEARGHQESRIQHGTGSSSNLRSSDFQSAESNLVWALAQQSTSRVQNHSEKQRRLH